MWHQAGARGMHRKLRAEGRVPGAEGRAKIEENRQRRAEEKRQATIAALSSVTAGEKGRDGLTKEQREANEMILLFLYCTDESLVLSLHVRSRLWFSSCAPVSCLRLPRGSAFLSIGSGRGELSPGPGE